MLPVVVGADPPNMDPIEQADRDQRQGDTRCGTGRQTGMRREIELKHTLPHTQHRIPHRVASTAGAPEDVTSPGAVSA